jgi:hypothetical protein
MVTFGMKTESQDCEHHNIRGKPGRSVTLLSLRGSSSCSSYGPKHQVAAQAVTDKPTYSLIGTAVLIRAYKNLPLRRSTVLSMKQYLQNIQVHILHFHVNQNIKVSVMGCALHERRTAALSMETTATDGNFQDFL